ncbi:hypothetical protein, partial [Algoriphagus hitonicola]
MDVDANDNVYIIGTTLST